MVYGNLKNLTRRTVSDKIVPDKEFDIAKNPKYDGNQRGLSSQVDKIFWKKNTAGCAFKNEIMKYKELAEELQK